jgi:hypothetical protein
MWKSLNLAGRCVAVLAVLGSGCQGKSATRGEGPAATSASARPKVGADDALVTELKTIGKTCRRAPGEDRFKCPNAQNWKLIADFMGKRRERGSAVSALASTLLDPEAGVRGLTASVLHSAFGGAWGRDTAPGAVSPEAARALLDSVLQQPAATAQQTIPAAVNAAMLAGQGESLYAELARPERAALRVHAYPYLMTMGRLRAFPKVQQLVKDADPKLAEATADAPLNMDAWTETEQQAICEWADGLLSDPRSELAAKASLLLAHCSGGRLDKMLTRAGELAAGGKLDQSAQGPLIAMCGGAQRPPKLAATPEQCKRARGLLVDVAQSTQTDAAARAYAVTWIATIWPDQESTRLLKRLQQDQSAEVARQARDSSRRLAEASAQQATAERSTSSAAATTP